MPSWAMYLITFLVSVGIIGFIAFWQHRSRERDAMEEDDPNDNGGSGASSNMQYIIGYAIFGFIAFVSFFSIIAVLVG